ncbi:type II secretion system protein [Pseudanabaena sp. FACHB-1998]|uniref:pilus assembly FimT family protein n=1 Tax=Pseudanabaena sp. FACHB-1998 TaxID=2692858 RepID=UPI001681845A|nr:type II secretion system protein [Pseudanabaena sp. FACHB-1998]
MKRKSKFVYASRTSGDRYTNRGFTLIEVLVVMIIIGILSAIVAPSWVSFVDNQRLNSSQTKIFAAIKAAQSDAKVRQTSDSQTVTNSKRSRITFTSSASTFSASSDATLRLDNVRTDSGVEQSLEKGITIASVIDNTSPNAQLSPVTIEFDSRGFIYKSSQVPICINLSTTNTTGRKRTSWIKIQTLLGALSTGKDTACS